MGERPRMRLAEAGAKPGRTLYSPLRDVMLFYNQWEAVIWF